MTQKVNSCSRTQKVSTVCGRRKKLLSSYQSMITSPIATPTSKSRKKRPSPVKNKASSTVKFDKRKALSTTPSCQILSSWMARSKR